MLNAMREARARYKRQLLDVLDHHPDSTLIPLRSKRVHDARFTLGLVSEVPAVFTVVAAGVSALQGGHDATGRVIAAAELITGACVLIAIAREARHVFSRKPSHAPAEERKASRIDGSNLAAAAMGYVEAWQRAHVTGHFKLVSPQVVGATASLVIALVGSRATGRRNRRRQDRCPHIAISPEGISYFPGLRGTWKARWNDVAAVEHDAGGLAVRLRDGRSHVLRAADHVEGDAILAEVRAAMAAHAAHVPGAVKFAGHTGLPGHVDFSASRSTPG